MSEIEKSPQEKWKEKKRENTFRPSAYKPKEGYEWNKWLKWGRNDPCPCLSGKKFKKCHLPHLSILVKSEVNSEAVKIRDDDQPSNPAPDCSSDSTT
jgi:hypothetical protein